MKKITRRDFVRVLGYGSAASMLSNFSCKTEPLKPNILLIHTDEHRMDCIGAYGNEDIQTPQIDKLAADGERFINSFCPYPVCTPSRYSLLSGLHVHEHRGWTNRSTLPPGIETFPSILKQHGYKTKAVGKMHFTPTYLDVGFEEMILAEQDGPGRWDDDYHRELRKHDWVDFNDLEDQRQEYRKLARKEYWETFGALPSNLPENFFSTTWIADRAVETLKRWGPSGNMLMVGFIKPHHPFDPPEFWQDMYDPEKISVLPGWTDKCFDHDIALSQGYFRHVDLTEKKIRLVTAYYYSLISQIDSHVGKMIDVLKEKGIYENTMIVFTSDHGDYMGFHHLLLKGSYMYDPLIKVPLIIKYPKNQKQGTKTTALVNNIDLAPTILRQAGCEPGARMRGYDLYEGSINRGIIFAHGRKGTAAMARSKRHKLLLIPSRKSLYFDLKNDPMEMNDLYDKTEHQAEIKIFKEAIEEWTGQEKHPETYLDERGPVIHQPNVQTKDDGHRKAMIEYYRKKMLSSTQDPSLQK